MKNWLTKLLSLFRRFESDLEGVASVCQKIGLTPAVALDIAKGIVLVKAGDLNGARQMFGSALVRQAGNLKTEQ